MTILVTHTFDNGVWGHYMGQQHVLGVRNDVAIVRDDICAPKDGVEEDGFVVLGACLDENLTNRILESTAAEC